MAEFEIDMFDVIKLINRRKGKFCALLASDLEERYGKNSPEFIVLKKLFFDYINDYTRSVNRILIGGEIE